MKAEKTEAFTLLVYNAILSKDMISSLIELAEKNAIKITGKYTIILQTLRLFINIEGNNSLHVLTAFTNTLFTELHKSAQLCPIKDTEVAFEESMHSLDDNPQYTNTRIISGNLNLKL